MEAVIYILIVIFAIVVSGKGKKANQKSGAARQTPPRQAPARTAAPRVQRAVERVAEPVEAREERAPVQLRFEGGEPELILPPRPERTPPTRFAPRLAEGLGASLEDDEGCLGGSMEHEHTEGESRAEHAEHLAAMRQRDAEERAAARSPRTRLGALTARDMRQAVVMSEILGRPRALRGRQGYYR